MDGKELCNKEITLCLSPDYHNALEILAERNSTTPCMFAALMIRAYILNISNVYNMAQFINRCSDEQQREIIKHEESLPSAYRQFTRALQKNPNAGQVAPHEDVPEYMKDLWKKGFT